MRGQVGHLSKEQFAALLDERYRIESNLRNSHIDEVHTLEQGFFIFKQAICSFCYSLCQWYFSGPSV